LVAFLLLAATSVSQAQQVCDGASTACSLEDLGNNRFRMTFTVSNNSSGDNVVFKWLLNAPFAPAEWVTVGFVVPPDWSGSHNGGHLQFQTPNGDGRTGRIYSPSVAGLCGGSSPLVFQWTFDNVGGPDPACNAGPLDYTYHMQGIDTGNCNNLGQSFVCPGTVPVEDSSWGKIKHAYIK
jgi:hypothetical protein